jgi:hypothetical protein
VSRAQLKHVLLDVDFLNNPKVRTLKTKFSHLSQLCLIDIYSAMSKATNAIIDRDCLESILAEYGVQIEFIDYCVERGLIQKETSGYTNSVVIKDQEQYYRKLNSGKNKSNSEQNFPEKIQEKSTPDIDSDSDYDNDSFLKKKESLPPDGVEVRKHVFLTESQKISILKKISQAELDYWLDQLTEYAQQNPIKWKKNYKNHLLVIRKWRRMRMEDGKVWDSKTKLYQYPSKITAAMKPENVYTDRNKVNQIRNNGISKVTPEIKNLVEGIIK